MCVKPAAGLEENDLQLQLTECNIYGILVGFCITLMLIYWVKKALYSQGVLMNFNDFSPVSARRVAASNVITE